MEQTPKIKKTNWLYLVDYIFTPLALCGLCYGICYLWFRDGGVGAVMTTLVPTILAAIWWIFGGSIIFKRQTKALEREFVAQGYKRNHTFYGRGKTVVLDIEKGILGIVFFWNPGEIYIVPASRIGKAWTDDGKMGSGFMEGSSQVKFVFTVDDIKVSVPTFQSNQRFRMDDKHILTGISKADMMVESLNAAKQNSEKAAGKDTGESTKTTAKTDTKTTKSEKSNK